MSMHTVLKTAHGALCDEATGLAVRVGALSAIAGIPVRTDFAFGRWALPETLTSTTSHRVVVRPASGAELPKQPGVQRDGVQTITILAEAFSARDEEIEDTLVLMQLGLMQVLDGLREYSDAHGGTVIDVVGEIRTRYGEFVGASAKSGGLVLTANISERSFQ